MTIQELQEKRQIGIIRLNEEMLKNLDWEVMSALNSLIFTLDTQYSYFTKVFTMRCVSPHFREVEVIEETPEYTVTITSTEGNLDFKFTEEVKYEQRK